MKRCPKCKETKPTTAFHKNSRSKDGCQYYCKECQSRYYKKKRFVPVGPVGGKRCSVCGGWYPVDSYYVVARHLDGYGTRCANCRSEINRAYYAENKERNKATVDRWKATERGRAKYREIAKRWINNKYHSDENFKKAHNLRCRLGKAWRWYVERGEHRVSMTGDIDFAAIFRHMGDCPGEYGRGEGRYTIDHLIPIRDLDLSTEEGWAIATHPFNHQWLEWSANRERGKEWDYDAYGRIMEDLEK